MILAFGDSLTHGTGAQSDEAYPRVLGDLIDRTVLVAATPGDQTAQGLAKLPQALDKAQPDLLILCLGGNDFLRKQPEAQIRANLARMIEMSQTRGIPVVLLGVPKPAVFGLSGHALYADLAKHFALHLDNTTIASLLKDRATKSDPIHPNAQGYRVLAEAVAQLLRQAGAV